MVIELNGIKKETIGQYMFIVSDEKIAIMIISTGGNAIVVDAEGNNASIFKEFNNNLVKIFIREYEYVLCLDDEGNKRIQELLEEKSCILSSRDKIIEMLDHINGRKRFKKGTIKKITDEYTSLPNEFKVRIKKGYEIYSVPIEKCIFYILTEEIRGIISADSKITEKYYKEFNRKCAFAFYNRLTEKILKYGGYSIEQILYDIEKIADELSGREEKSHLTYIDYRLRDVAKRICRYINKAFADDREIRKKEYISEMDTTRYGTLNPISNWNSSDPIINLNSRIMNSCHTTINPNSKYLSFPVCEDAHLTDDVMEEVNIKAFLAPIVAGYGTSGGHTVLLIAGTGIGKTYAIIHSIAQILGELCNSRVYMTMPNTPQLDQARKVYGCDVVFGDGSIIERGTNPNIRCYIYECVDEIPAITEDPITHNGHPNILIIDEAHSLLTDKYRKDGINLVNRKAKEILSAGGVVIAMTATAETIAATIPYNSMMGYDLICNIFRVNNRNALSEKLNYPYYSYDDVVKYGDQAGVNVVNAIPADNIRVMYQNPEDNNITNTLIAVICREISLNRKIIAEYNKKDVLTTIKNKLEDMGHRVIICHSDDKGYTYDENKNKRYNNVVFNDIINSNCIDYSDINVVLTTKLLENGTSITHVKGVPDEKRISTIYVVDRKDRFSLEAFEQFSGRLRFRHDDAILLTVKPEESNNISTKTLGSKFGRKMDRVKSLSEKIQTGIIPEARLSNIDFMNKEDLAIGLGIGGIINASTIAEATYSVITDDYKSLMYNREKYESVILERYTSKNVSFEELPKSDIRIKKSRESINEESRLYIRNCLIDAFNDPDKRIILMDGYDKSGTDKEKTMELFMAMDKYSRISYKKVVQPVLAIAFMLQNINSTTDKLSDNLKKVPRTELDAALTDDGLVESLSNAIASTYKGDINSILSDTISTGFRYLSNYPSLSRPLSNYAMKHGDRHQDVEDLLHECERCLPEMPSDLKNIIVKLMNRLFTSEIKIRIDRLVYTCPYIGNINMDFYATMSKNNGSNLDKIQFAYECNDYLLNPDKIHSEDTASGATFDILTSCEAYVALTGCSPDMYKGIESFSKKRVTKDRVEKLYDIYINGMRKRGFGYDKDRTNVRLKILRFYASILSFEQHIKEIKGEKKEVYIILGDIRKDRIANYYQIIRLNFRTIV